MVHGQHVHFKWHVFVIYLFLSPDESLICVSSMDTLLVWTGGSLMIFQYL